MIIKIGALFGLLLIMLPLASFGYDDSQLASAYKYGNILINRVSAKGGVKPATFSHWIHRQKYTCRVCHFELEFNMKVNTTEITEAANKGGRYCGASGCHDGKSAFGHDELHCEKCHNGKLTYGKEKFAELSSLPKTMYGNNINWSEALKRGLIKPVNYLTMKPGGITYDKQLLFGTKRAFVAPSVFPHTEHTQWLDCSNCHPDIFNIKKKGTRSFAKAQIVQGRFCGACHGTVAFPLMDCQRCHQE